MKREVRLGSNEGSLYIWHFKLGDRVRKRSSGDPDDVGVVESGKRIEEGECGGGSFQEMYEVRRDKDGLCYRADVEEIERF